MRLYSRNKEENKEITADEVDITVLDRAKAKHQTSDKYQISDMPTSLIVLANKFGLGPMFQCPKILHTHAHICRAWSNNRRHLLS